MLRTLFILGRVSNLPTVWTNVIVGWFLASGNWNNGLVWLLAGISLIYIAGMTLNDAFDAEWDARNAPERPIPTGAIKASTVWAIGILEMILGIFVTTTIAGASPVWIGSLVGAIILYDWLHKRWIGSVLIMGACRSLVYLAAASAVAGVLIPEWSIWTIAIGMLLYIAGITLAARGERDAEGNEPTLAKVLLMAPIASILLLSNLSTGPTQIIGLLLGFVLTFTWTRKARLKLKDGKIGPGVTQLLAGIILIDAIIIFYVDWKTAFGCLILLLPLTLWAQRRIPAT